MGTKSIILVTYIIIILIVELFIERRLRILKERHQQKIGGGYASGGLGKIHSNLLIIIRILFILLGIISFGLIFII